MCISRLCAHGTCTFPVLLCPFVIRVGARDSEGHKTYVLDVFLGKDDPIYLSKLIGQCAGMLSL